MNKSLYPQLNDEAWLRQRYVVERLTLQQVAAEADCSTAAVARALDRVGIERERRGPADRFAQLADKAWLEREIRDKPMRLIAQEIGCSYSGVREAIRRLGIEVPHRNHYRMTVDKSEAVKRGLARRFPEGRPGSRSSNWRGGVRRSKSGYISLHREVVRNRWPNHPRLALDNWTYCQEHRLVMEYHLGRPLEPTEFVDHGPGGPSDNRIENLSLKSSRGEHTADHWRDAMEAARLRERVVQHEADLAQRDERIAELERQLQHH